MKKFISGILLVSTLALASCGATKPVDKEAQSTPEGVVEAFYETFAENPDNALEFVSEEARQSDRMKNKWEEFKEWKLVEFEVLEFDDPYVSVDLLFEIEGEIDGGQDEAEVVQIGDYWWIVSIPT